MELDKNSPKETVHFKLIIFGLSVMVVFKISLLIKTRNSLIISGFSQGNTPIKDIPSICGQRSEIRLLVPVQGFSTAAWSERAH